MDISQDIKVAVDAIVFGYNAQKLHVLLIKQKFGLMKDKWVLVGGFVKNNEALKDAVARELKEEAGIKVNYLEQLYTFGDNINRDPRMRVISVSYFGLVNSSKLKLTADTDAEDARWFTIDEVPKLGYDHQSILKVALERLRNKLKYEPIGFDLLDKEFPFSDLENLYCTILEKDIDRRNFRKKILSYGLLEETDKINQHSGRGRKGVLYKFNKERYRELEKQGLNFEMEF